MASKKDLEELEEQMAGLEYSNLIGRAFGSGKGVGGQVRLWERRNLGKLFDDMDINDLRKGIVLLLEMRKQHILALIGGENDGK
jgi:hypothetical protein